MVTFLLVHTSRRLHRAKSSRAEAYHIVQGELFKVSVTCENTSLNTYMPQPKQDTLWNPLFRSYH